ncbi:arrestin domain-containing protein 3-like [Ostrea edulis]|uniref:arrestin domain-containing protein 3-like n=1 Tax=Ostrea edulis TaxID=37623 RepID=UPI0024AFBB16|nr:arrestin domain-containing protein 3-like [Ostrea edulis]
MDFKWAHILYTNVNDEDDNHNTNHWTFRFLGWLTASKTCNSIIMVKLRSFKINLDNSKGIFVSGETVSGRATVDVESEITFQEINLVFDGKAYVHWSEKRGSKDNRRTVFYSGTESYFNNVVCVLGKGLGGGDEHILHPGQYVYPFSFVLPPNLPSSFEGGVGHVRYTIRGTIDRPWGLNYNTVLAFTVLSALDLNQQPLATNGAEATDSKMLCCWCCESGPITGTIKVNRVGYVPGESLYFEASVQNMSNRVCRMSAAFEMVTVFQAKTRRKTVPLRINTITHQSLQPGDSEVWGGERFILPPLPPSYLPGCNIIDIRYILKLAIVPSGIAINMYVPVEIIIGTIPLQSAVEQYQQTLSSAQPSAPPQVAMPAPSYNESIMGSTNIAGEEDGEQTQGQLDFTPTYTYYDWSKST